MNEKIISIIKERNIHPTSYKKINSVYVINNQFAIKLNTNNYDIYKYLISRDFLYFPRNLTNINDNYDISKYINGLKVNDDQKINDYLKILALLHKKTSYKREIDLDEIKEKYESINNQIIYLKNYYLKLNDKLDQELFFSPSAYLLLRNISLIYSILDNSELLLNDIYSKLKTEKSIRVSLLHNNINLDHLIISDNEYLVSWDKSYFDSPIYEIEEFYRKYFQIIDLSDLFKIYESINSLTDLEKKYLLILLAIPKEIKLTDNTLLDTQIINNEINYLNKVYELLIKYKSEMSNKT